MNITFFGASFDAADAAHTAQFWAAALNRRVAEGADEQDAVVEADDPGSGPRLAFHQVPETKTAKNRFHPDLITSDYEGETERLLALGATKLNVVEVNGARWTTFADVEGNEFDLIAG
ncbi:VOC family protein [Streptomyces sp. SID13031]|uniref:VOC family protein n=1 Tax=Streptomyces sp. SID13031 TaxID=2706046 RepID=UPI0013C8A270|nr:VOC family protein [Streptomyces sp. SID13031]NEA31096.1 VOC family protein [Streptomyces sp. SID13031]